MSRLIDIHTHNVSSPDDQHYRLRNILLPKQDVPPKGNYSAGWHPWHIEKNSIAAIEQKLHEIAHLKQVMAIGECGIDRAIETGVSDQMKVFKIHLSLAAEVKKPIIVHAVRSYSDIAQVLKECRLQLPVVFHDYRGNRQQTSQLLRFNSYFSFGEALLKYPQIGNKINEIPRDRLFLETDESKLSIEKIYISAASTLDISIEELSMQIDKNFRILFGDGLVKQD